MMKRLLLLLSLLSAGPLAAAEAPPTPALEHRSIRVAFALSEGAVMIDFAGPWEVFQDVHVPGRGGHMSEQMPFELYTVGPSREPLRSSGGAGGHANGMQVIPDYSYADAPPPDIVVVPAQHGSAALAEWLRKVHAQKALLMSVCTGSFQLAQAGLLDGKPATAHHGALQRLANRFPGVAVRGSVRYVQADPQIFTASGLSSGIDLALHIVERYFGREVAQATADDMEYQGEGWKTNAGVGERERVLPTIAPGPGVTISHWRGSLRPDFPKTEPAFPIAFHIAATTEGHVATVDLPAQGVYAEPINIQVEADRIALWTETGRGRSRFDGTLAADHIVGELSEAGAAAPVPLTLNRTPE